MKVTTKAEDLISAQGAYHLYNPFTNVYWIVKDSIRLFEFLAHNPSEALQIFDKYLKFFEFLDFVELDCTDVDKSRFIKLWIERNGLIYTGDTSIIIAPKLTK